MPRDPSLGAPEKVLGYVLELLGELNEEVIFWRLEDPDDLGSWRMVLAGHDISPSTGAHYSEFMGKPMGELFPAFLETEGPAVYAQALRTGKAQALPAMRYAHDGVLERVYDLTVYPVADNIIAVWIRNVTELERLERERQERANELQRNSRELQRSNQQLEELAYVASHDLKAPLRDIGNLAAWIAEDAGEHLPDKSAAHLQRLRDRIVRMHRLLDDLLDYSRVGRIPQNPEEIDMGALLHDTCALAAAPPGFQIILPQDMPAVRTPRAPLQRVLLNLIGNAIKHHDREAGQIDISWRELGDTIEIAVADDGPGIPSKFHERIFRLFTTLEPRDKVEGSGMGLALVKKMVESHGGAISLTCGDRGTVFRFTWPKSWPPETAGQSGDETSGDGSDPG